MLSVDPRRAARGRAGQDPRALTTFDQASRHLMPPELHPTRPHTHHASDDAQEQAELFNRVFAWALEGGGSDEAGSPDGGLIEEAE
jgi:hypothetical protein